MEVLRELEGTVALVTGAGQGLGLAFVEALVENGARVSLLDINNSIGCKTINYLENKYNIYDRILFINCDITIKDKFEDAFKETIAKFGKINIVINNAGIMTKYIDSWELAIDLNFKAVVHGTILGLQYIDNKANTNSAVINIGSTTGLSNSILPIYQSTKRAVIDFTKCIGCSYNSKANHNNIRVVAICPGPTFDGFDNDTEGKHVLEQKMRVFMTCGDENPNPNRIILVQRTEYVKTALLHVIKNGKSGDVWIAENEEYPRLSNLSNEY